MQKKNSNSGIIPYFQKHWFWIAVNIGALTPLLLVILDVVNGRLVDPIADITNRTGYTALVLLVLSLAVTPLNSLTGWRTVTTVRKSLGLQGFFYVCLHLLTFLGLDYAFNLSQILGDALVTKPYIIVGFSAFLILTPLAITSTKGWMKRLGRNWKKLHRLVYVAVPLAVIHYFWVLKVPVEPTIYGIVVALLLVARIPAVRQRLNQVRKFLDGKPAVSRPKGRLEPVAEPVRSVE
ncbi:MAG: protein-methionine-sulfoxide reductase heme-binding subunit MsrQ [Caldilineaceae bacterium]